jgi:hypothetical protein
MRTVLLAALGTLAACAPSPMHAPAVTTAAGRECVQTCRSLYNVCVGELQVGGNYWSFNQPNSLGDVRNCDENLAGCYATCVR